MQIKRDHNKKSFERTSMIKSLLKLQQRLRKSLSSHECEGVFPAVRERPCQGRFRFRVVVLEFLVPENKNKRISLELEDKLKN